MSSGKSADALEASGAAASEGAGSAVIAERVRAALLERALAAHDDARLQGLCMEGAWEAAVSAMRALDVTTVARGASGEGNEGS